ncbi:MAG: STAS domain-containing protein [Opitutaceae bacterium]
MLNSSRQGDLLCLTVTAPRLDASSVREFKVSTDSVWSSVTRRVEIDMAGVEFLDSSGVGALLSIYKRLPAPAQVKLVHVRPAVQTVIELLRLHRIFEVHGEVLSA